MFQNYEIEAQDRDGLVAHLASSGVEVLVSWGGKGIHQFASLGLPEYHLPRTEEMFRNVLMLPMHTELEDDQVGYVAQTVREFYGAR